MVSGKNNADPISAQKAREGSDALFAVNDNIEAMEGFKIHSSF